jgi:hypothetical protein
MKNVAVLQIDNCKNCPHVRTERDYTSDSWEIVEKFTCCKAEKVIERYVDWYQKVVAVPDWCPIIVVDNQ